LASVAVAAAIIAVAAAIIADFLLKLALIDLVSRNYSQFL
jgi:hypothetical protein